MGMRYQPTGTPEPRDNRENGDRLAEVAESEMVDLGESPLPSRLDVPPASVRSLGRRLDPRLAPVVAVAIVVVALLGTGPLASHPSPTPSGSQHVGLASITPEPTEDPCPPATAKPPTISLGSRTTFAVRAAVSALGQTPDGPAVEVPVKRTVDVKPGAPMRLDVLDRRCIELVGIDLIDTSRPTGDALMVRLPAPLDEGSRTVDWDAPPAGDWVVRVALKLRAPLAGDKAGPWAVYFYRMNSGYVAWASPVPDGADGGTAQGPLVTPAVPCGPLPTGGTTPPVVDLVAAGASHPGLLGDYRWNGVVVSAGVPASVNQLTPIAVSAPFELLIEGRVCATEWRIEVEAWPGFGNVFGATGSLDQSPENPGQHPEIASQNTFMFQQDAYGTYIIQASFEFESGEHEVVYWVVQAASPATPDAHLAAQSSGDRVALVRSCGASFQIGDRYGNEICTDMLWPELPNGPILSVDAESELRLDAGGQLIVGWSVEYVDQASIALTGRNPGCVVALTSGYSGVGLSSLEVPPLPPGAWSVRVSLTVRVGTDSLTVPYFTWLEVAGEPGPSPSQGCFID